MAIQRDKPDKRERPQRRAFEMPKRKCRLCEDQVQVDYKQPDLLKRYLTERGKILSRRSTGACARHQREITRAIKKARVMMLVR
ncbi:MAG: 30S ribosomal protein S18 [Verrucomicrobiae bacterium]|nr:30S ribosomal protein S18 [Verrucomicrobiae bacterium]